MNDLEYDRQLQMVREGKLRRITPDTPCAAVARKNLNEMLRYIAALEAYYNAAQGHAEIRARLDRAKK